MRSKAILASFLILLFTLPAMAAEPAPEPVKPIQAGDVLPYLEQVIAWQRAVAETELLPDNAREVMLKDRLRKQSKEVLLKGFEFGRAQAVISGPAASAGEEEAAAVNPSQTRRARLMKSSAEVNATMDALLEQLRTAKLTLSQREKIMGDVKLTRAQQELLQTMLRILNSEGETSGTLLDQINALSRTAMDEPSPVAEKDTDQEKADQTPVAAPTVPEEKFSLQESDGMLKLSIALFSHTRKKNEIAGLLKETQALIDTNRGMMRSIRASLRAALAEGSKLTAGGDAKGVKDYRDALDGLVLRYKQLSATIVPLSEENSLLRGMERRLQEWSRLIDDGWSRVLRQLLTRLVILAVAVAIPLALSELARRATQRYVQDPKRQRLLRIARRVILGIVLAFVILANFISEFGSLATFAGFITAGLAVALQTVLVSLVAHFFFFGRYGVRAGDRITVADVTGDVVQVGMLRLYMRQLEDTGDGLKPTGKMVAFPNSILFQPTAFYKHVEF